MSIRLYDKDVGVESLKTLPDDKTTGWKFGCKIQRILLFRTSLSKEKKDMVYMSNFFLDKMCVIVIV